METGSPYLGSTLHLGSRYNILIWVQYNYDNICHTHMPHPLCSSMKAWSDIMKSYEDGNVYLAECGQHLARLVNYELPALKHQINRSQQVIRVRHHGSGGVCGLLTSPTPCRIA